MRVEGLVGRGDVEVAQERVARPGRDLADLGEARGAAVGVEAVQDLVGRAVAAEAEDAVVGGPGGLAADLDGVAGALGHADLEAGEGLAEAGLEALEDLLAAPVPGGRIDDEECFHGVTVWDL